MEALIRCLRVISLATLRKLADALDCELQYALVPRKQLGQQLNERALLVASDRLRPVSHSMALEDQTVNGSIRDVQRQLLAKELFDGPWGALW